MVGDVYLLDQGAVLATCYGLKFQEMKRHVLHSLLSPVSSKDQGRQDQKESPCENVFPLGKAEVTRFGNGSCSSRESSSTEIPNAPTPASTEQETNVCNRIATIIAEQIGIDRKDLKDDTVFAEMGLDSLLSISVLARLKAETELILSSSFFNDNPRLREVRLSLGGPLPQHQTCRASLKPRSTGLSNKSTRASIEKDNTLYDKTAVIIAEEIGVDRNDISDGTMLAEIGLDSLLAISILTRLKENTGQVLSSSFFNDHPRLEDVRRSLGEPLPQRETCSASPKPPSYEDWEFLKEEVNPQGSGLGGDGYPASAKDHLESIT